MIIRHINLYIIRNRETINDNEQWSPVAQITEIGGYTTFVISEDKLYYMYEDTVGGDCSMAIIDNMSTLIDNAIGEVGISLADKL